MPTSRHTQTSLASGEFDPLLWSREDVSFFYNSARIIENCVPLPQGGAKRREGWRFRAVQRGNLSTWSVAGATATAPNGGTAANAIDVDSTTSLVTTAAIGATAVYEIVRINLGAVRTIDVVDVTALRLENITPGDPSSAQVALQRFVGGVTWEIVATLNIGTAAYDRRFAMPPDQSLGTGDLWRLVVLNDGDLGTATITLAEVTFRREIGYSNGGAIGRFAVHRLTTDIENEYSIWITADAADVFRTDTGAWVACIDMPYTDGQLVTVKNASYLDSMILYHQGVAPWIIQRLGSDADWRSGAVEFDSIVQFPFDTGSLSGGKNEIQFFRFESMTAGDKLIVEYNGEATAEIVWNASEATNTAALEAAIEGLEDITSVSVTVDNGTGVDADLLVEFTGDDGNQGWPILIVDILTGDGTCEVSHKQFGEPRTAPLWGGSRGYPRCGAFYQGRHWMGGFRARPDLLVASRAGSLFDFKEDADPVAGSPIVVAPNSDDQVTIYNIYSGRHLQIFSSSAEFYIPDEPITIDNIALKTTSRHGSNALTQPVDIQGGTLFIDRNGRSLREYLYQDAEQSYSAEPVSILAGHLIAEPRSLVLRRARDVDEPTLLLIANTGIDRYGDKVPAAMCVIDRAQQVTGFFRVKTDGTPLAFSSSQSGDAFAVTQRSVNGPVWNYLEQFDDDYMSDCGVKVTGSGSTISLVGVAEHLEGETVQVHNNGLPLGQFVVSGNTIDLGDQSYDGVAEVGLRMVPRIVLHPYKGKGDISPTMTNMRIFRALLQLERTAAVAICMDGDRPRAMSLQNYDSGLMDPTLDELLFSGAKRVSGIGRWKLEPALEITQLEPMPFLLRSVSYDVRF